MHQQAWRTFQNCLLGAAGADLATMVVVSWPPQVVRTDSIAPLKETFEARHCEARAERAGKRSGPGSCGVLSRGR